MRRNRSRRELLAVSSLAVATSIVVGASQAHAQVAVPTGSYQANGTFVGGGGSITTGAGTTDISISTPTAVIDWSPFDASGNGVINFQPQSTTATFHNTGFGGDDFAVLNRVVPSDTSRPIAFNGTTISQIQGDISTNPGGTVFFYSPGGILVGATAVFDVGNLGLTTSDLVYDASGNTFSPGGVYKFLPANAGTSVEIAKGASITSSTGGNSYVALVAPKVVQSGTLNVDGSVAMVAADAATIQFSPDGLFNITVDQGTSAAGTVLSSDGAINGPVGTAGTLNHRIYAVAVPKNDAITMAISGGNSLGFAIAGAADVVGNTIVLSSGYDIVAGKAADTASAGGGTGQADLILNPGTYTSAVYGRATGSAHLTVAAGQTANFASDLTLAGVSNAANADKSAARVVITGAGANMTVGGNLIVRSLDSGAVTGSGVSDDTVAAIDMQGGLLDVSGNLIIDASRTGLAPGASALGGLASLSYGSGSVITLHGLLGLVADGVGASDLSAGGSGGNGVGGTAQISGGTGGGTLGVAGNVVLSALGLGGSGNGTGGNGGGGSAAFVLEGTSKHTVNIGGTFTASTDAFAGEGGTTAGNAQGGTSRIEALDGAHALSVTGLTALSAQGTGANSETGGTATGGTTYIRSDGAGFTLGSVLLNSVGTSPLAVLSGVGSVGTGGDSYIDIGPDGGTITTSDVLINSYGSLNGGSGRLEASAGSLTVDSITINSYAVGIDAPLVGSSSTGGTAAIQSTGGAIHVNTAAFLSANADAGDGEVAGNATGGLAEISAIGGSVNFGADSSVTMDSSAIGGSSTSAINISGTGTGGTARVRVGSGGSIAVGNDLSMSASGTGGSPSGEGLAGGFGFGGTVAILGETGGGTLGVGGNTTLTANGVGIFGGGCITCSQEGGNGTGGTITISAVGAPLHAFTFTGTLSASATGTGGSAQTNRPGDAFGGDIAISSSGSAHTFSFGSGVTLDATAFGGVGNDVNGGAATGGSVSVLTNNGGKFTFGAGLTLDSHAEGGGYFGSANGATAQGGTSAIEIGSGGGSITTGALTLAAYALGGGGLDSFNGGGGEADGGTASITAAAGSVTVASATLQAYADGGTGIDFGGFAFGGSANITSTGGTVHVTGGASLDTSGLGGFANSTGGNGRGGSASISATGGIIDFGAASVTLDSSGTGGVGRFSSQTGGLGQGGTANVFAQNGSVTFAGAFTGNVTGTGGEGQFSASAGAGSGGAISINAASDAAGESLIQFATATLTATGVGGVGGAAFTVGSAGGDGGSASGGSISVNGGVGNASVTAASLTANASGTGGPGGVGTFTAAGLGTPGGNGGNGTGGTITFSTVDANAGSTTGGEMILGSLTATATGRGGLAGFAGDPTFPTGVSGSGQGGTVSIRVEQVSTHSEESPAYFEVTGTTSIVAQGRGANGRGCNCISDGGSGTGGTVFIGSTTSSSGSQLRLLGSTSIDASGIGGNSLTTAGADAIGGKVDVLASGSLAIETAGISVSAVGFGGNAVGTFAGGLGTGGSALINATLGGTVAVTGDVSMGVNGVGGANTTSGGVGGNGLGGNVAMGTTGSSIVGATGGAITVSNNVQLVANGQGGAGNSASAAGKGGNGTGGTSSLFAGTQSAGGNGGSIAIAGSTVLQAAGLGAAGYNGGAGTGGAATIVARDGSISGATNSLAALGRGGNGARSGNGGEGTGGQIHLSALSDLAGAASVTFTGISQMSADGLGGSVSAALSASDIPGTGGAGTGGIAVITAGAGNGTLALGDMLVTARGLGGAGGLGGPADVGAGGNGGDGGIGRGGAIQVGTESGIDTGSVNSGSASFGAVSAVADGAGGAGGGGGTGTTVNGDGGDGGAGFGGGVTLLVRGSPVTLTGDGQFTANGIGGTAGTGATSGIGGAGTVGDPAGSSFVAGAGLTVTNRNAQPAQRGLLTAKALSFQAVAVGGSGSTSGATTDLGGPVSFIMTNSDVNATSIDFVAGGSAAIGGVPESEISLTNGTATFDGAFGFSTPNNLSVSLVNADLFANQITISAGNWIPGVSGGANFGTLHSTTAFELTSGGNLFAFAALDSGEDLTLTSSGQIRFDDVTTAGNFTADAATSLDLGNVFSGGDAGLSAGTGLTVGTVDASGGVTQSAGLALVTGGVTAGQGISLSGTSSVTVNGSVVAGDFVTITSDGGVSAGLVSAGQVNQFAAPAGSYGITVVAGGNIALGDVLAVHDVRLFGSQSVTARNVAGRELAILSGGDQTFRLLSATGRVLLAGIDGASAGGDPLSPTYDLDALFAATPVATPGTIDILLTASASSFRALTESAFLAGTISTTNSIDVDAGNAVAISDVTARDSIRLVSGSSLSLGTASADNLLALTALDSIDTGSLVGVNGVTVNSEASVFLGGVEAGSGAVTIDAVGSVTLGLIGARTTGLPAIIAADAVTVTSIAGGITLGDVTSTGSSISITANGGLSAANFAAQTGVDIDTGDGLSIGTVTSAASDITLATDGDIDVLDIQGTAGRVLLTAGANVYTTDIVAGGSAGEVGLSIDAGGDIASGTLRATGDIAASAALTLTTGNITTGQSISLSGTDGVTIDGTAIAGNAVTIASDGDVTAGLISAGLVNPSAAPTATYGITVVAGGNMALSDVRAAHDVRLFGSQGVSARDVSGRDLAILSGDGQAFRSISATGRVLLAGIGGASAGGSPLSPTDDLDALFAAVPVATAGSIDIEGETGAVSFSAATQSSFSTSSITTTGDVNIDTGGQTNISLIDADGSIRVNAGEDLSIGSASAQGLLTLTATVDIFGGQLVGVGGVSVNGGAAVLLDSVTSGAGAVTINSAGSLTMAALQDRTTSLPAITAADAVTITSDSGDVTLGDVTSTGSSISLTANGALSAANFDAQNGVDISVGDGLSIGTVTSAASDINLASTGEIDVLDIQGPASRVFLTAGTDIFTTNIVAGGAFGGTGVRIDAGGDFAGGSITASGGEVRLLSLGLMDVDDITASGGPVTIRSGGTFNSGAIQADRTIDLVSKGDATIAGAMASTHGNISLDVAGVLSAGSISALAGGVVITATSDITTQAIDAETEIDVAGRELLLGALTADSVTANARAGLTSGVVRALGGDARLAAGHGAAIDNVSASGAIVLSSGQDMTTGALVAGNGVTATSDGSITAVSVRANGGDVSVTSAGLLQSGTITALAGSVSLGGTGGLISGDIAAFGSVTGGGGSLLLADVDAGGAVNLSTIGAGSIGDVTAGGNVTVAGSGTMATGGITSQGGISLTSSGQAVQAGALDAQGGDVVLEAKNGLSASTVSATGLVSGRGRSIALGNVTSGGTLDLTAVNTLTTVDVSSQGDATFTAGGDVTTGSLTGAGAFSLVSTSGLISTDIIDVGGAITVDAGTSATLANVRSASGDVRLRAGTDLSVGVIAALGGDVVLSAGGILDGGNVTASGLLSGTANAITLATLTTGGASGLTATNALTTGDVLSQGNVVFSAGGDLAVGNVTGKQAISLTSTGGLISAGAIDAQGGGLVLSAHGNLTTAGLKSLNDLTGSGVVILTGDILSNGGLNLTATDALTSGTVNAAGNAVLAAAGDLAVGNVTGLGNLSLTSSGGSVSASAVSGLGSLVNLSAAGALTTADITSGNTITASGNGITAGAITTLGGPATFTSTGLLTTGGIDASGSVTGSGTTVTLGKVHAIGSLQLTAANGLTVDTVRARDGVTFTADGDIAAGDVTGGGNVSFASASGKIVAGAIFADGGDADLVAAGTLTAGGITANVLTVSADAIDVGNVVANGALSLTSAHALKATSLHAGSDLALDAGDDLLVGLTVGNGALSIRSRQGSVTTGDLDAKGTIRLDAATLLTVASAITTTGNVQLRADGDVTSGAITAQAGAVQLVAGGSLVSGNILASGAVSASGHVVTLADVTASDDVDIVASTDASAGVVNAIGGNVTVATGGLLTLVYANSNGGALTLTAAETLSTGDLFASGDITLSSAGNVTVRDLDGGGLLSLSSTGGEISARTLVAGGGIAADAATNLTVASARSIGGDVTLGATGDLSVGLASAQAGTISLTAGGTLNGGNLNASNAVFASGHALTLGDVTGGGNVTLASSTDGTAGIVNSTGGNISVGTGGLLKLGSANAAGGTLNLTTLGAIQTGDLFAGGDVLLNAGTTINVGRISAASRVVGISQGNGVYTSADTHDGSIELVSNTGSLSVGQLFDGGQRALVAAQNLNVGFAVGDDLALLAGGDVNVQSSLVTGTVNPVTGTFVPGNGTVLIGDVSLAALGGDFGAFDYNAVFAAPTDGIGGSVQLGGAIAGRFVSASSGAMRSGRITASQSILVTSGDLVTVAAQWAAPSISIRSADIAILQAPSSPTSPTQPLSGLNAGADGAITLVSLDSQTTQVGDGLSGTGYTLDNTEWSRINSGSLALLANNFVIGKLDVTGPDAGSTIDDPNGAVRFITAGSASGSASGSIRIVGDLKTSGFRATNALEFFTGLFELQSDTGSLSVNGTGNALNGTLRISADHIHVATGAVLEKLASNPFYVGALEDLDGPATSVKQDGVLRAGAIDFRVGHTLFIENMGTSFAPTGFVVPLSGLQITPTAGSQIAVIINGQFQTDTGLVSGTAAFDLFKSSTFETTDFDSDSRLNDCLINLPTCGSTPTSGLADEIRILTGPGLGDTPDFVGDDPDDPNVDDGADKQPQPSSGPDLGSPIAPPPPLIDTRPLDPPPLIDEPVAGSGNPALMGAAVNENTAQGGQN